MVNELFAIILAICFIPAPGRAEAVSVLQRTTELRTPPSHAIGDDPGRGDQFAGVAAVAPRRQVEPMGKNGQASSRERREDTHPAGGRGTQPDSSTAPGVEITPIRHTSNVLWKVSVGALAGGSALDSASSWQQYEANPLLRGADGRFGARGLAIKSGVLVGFAVVQYLVIRRIPKAVKIFAVLNFGLGASYTGMAVRNWRMDGTPKTQ